MDRSIIFIHGMFQNAKSWENWTQYFTGQGYKCIAESWPFHEGDPSALRASPPLALGDLRLNEVYDKYLNVISKLERPPIAIGHSVGGLIVQKLAENSLIEAGVAIASVAPNRMLTFDWGFFRNSLQITNPIAGDEPFEMTAEAFHKNFANTLTREESDVAYTWTATHDSRNVLRDCMLEPGQIELSRASCPLFFIGAEKDMIIPPQLCEKNANAYSQGADYQQFSNRGHFICGEPDWMDVTTAISTWLKKHSL